MKPPWLSPQMQEFVQKWAMDRVLYGTATRTEKELDEVVLYEAAYRARMHQSAFDTTTPKESE